MFRLLRKPALILACPVFASAAALAEGGMPQMTTTDDAMPEFNVMGFGDISYISEDSSDEDGFVIGQAVAHLSASLSDALGVFGEFSASARDSEYSFEVERLIVKYEFSDRYKLSAGRYHTPVGYWNSAYHHGAWLQTTVARPEYVKFGSSLVPIHFVGVLLEGTLPSGSLGLTYKAGYGNGRHENIVRAGDAGDINSDKAWTFQLRAKPQNVYGLEAGIGYYSDEVPLPGGETVTEGMLSAFVVWNDRANEFIVEYLSSNHELDSNSAVDGDVDAWYAQYAYRFPGNQYHAWKPYSRIERTRIDDTDPLVGSLGLDYDAAIIGVRWDFNPYAALKAEYRREEFDNAGYENNFRLQLSFALAKL